LIGGKIIRTSRYFRPINDFTQFFRFSLNYFFSFVSLSSHWPRPPPHASWPKSDSDFRSEDGPCRFMGSSRRPVRKACSARPPVGFEIKPAVLCSLQSVVRISAS
jgi:hypothetical protein